MLFVCHACLLPGSSPVLLSSGSAGGAMLVKANVLWNCGIVWKFEFHVGCNILLVIVSFTFTFTCELLLFCPLIYPTTA